MKWEKLSTETVDEYIYRIGSAKEIEGCTWEDIGIIANKELKENLCADTYRKRYNRMLADKTTDKLIHTESDGVYNELVDEYNDIQLKVDNEKLKLRDYLNQNRANSRVEARYNNLRDIAIDVAKELNTQKPFILTPKQNKNTKGSKAGILAIGDWHYGIEYDGYWNTYNPEVCKERVSKLFDKVMEIIEKENISTLVVVNMGDMISGNIHLQLRITSRLDVVTQTIQVGEIIAEFLAKLSEHVRVDYCSVTDNHSRIEPHKADSFKPESFARFIDWHLRERLRGNVSFQDNIYGDDIASFSLWDHNIVAVHGDKDPQKGIIERLNGYIQDHIDLILSAHLHHFSADESNFTEYFCVGSMCGTDDYASSLRLNSKPSQLMIVSTPENVTECIYKIKLD